MNVLILGSGGREHAFAWKIAQSSSCNNLFIAPGNAGTSSIGENINISPNDFNEIKKFVLKENIDIVIVGPEDPLVNGIFDFFENDKDLNKITVIGPSKNGALLEGSKEFAKKFMEKYYLNNKFLVHIYDFHQILFVFVLKHLKYFYLQSHHY